jgi:hypothetical protein
VLEVDALPGVPLRERRQVSVKTGPVERFHLLLDRRTVGVFRFWIDLRLGIQGVENKARRRGVVDVL